MTPPSSRASGEALRDVADLLGMTPTDVRRAVADMKDDGTIDPSLFEPPPPDRADLDAEVAMSRRQKGLPPRAYTSWEWGH
jgi:hypothetical protein